jgi:hypothetical protein
VSGDLRPLASGPTRLHSKGTIQPGVIWPGNYFQVGVEAVIPVNGQSGSTIGVMAQLHLYLDDIFPTTVGQPLLGKSTPLRLPFGG